MHLSQTYKSDSLAHLPKHSEMSELLSEHMLSGNMTSAAWKTILET